MPARSTHAGSGRSLKVMSPSGSGSVARAAAVATLSLALVACGTTPSPPEAADPLDEASSRSTLPSNVGPANCAPPSPAREIDLGLEVAVATDVGEIWALFRDPDVRSGEPLTVWWKIPGTAELDLVLVGGEREVAVAHTRPDPTLRWPRPGDQWVSTITFPQPGCWRISATRGTVHGDAWIRVA